MAGKDIDLNSIETLTVSKYAVSGVTRDWRVFNYVV